MVQIRNKQGEVIAQSYSPLCVERHIQENSDIKKMKIQDIIFGMLMTCKVFILWNNGDSTEFEFNNSYQAEIWLKQQKGLKGKFVENASYCDGARYTIIYNKYTIIGPNTIRQTEMKRIHFDLNEQTLTDKLEELGIHDNVAYIFHGHPPMDGEKVTTGEALILA